MVWLNYKFLFPIAFSLFGSIIKFDVLDILGIIMKFKFSSPFKDWLPIIKAKHPALVTMYFLTITKGLFSLWKIALVNR